MIGKPGFLWTVLLAVARYAWGQSDTLGLSEGTTSFSSSFFDIELVTQSQTLFSLVPSDSIIDYIPADVMSDRAGNLNYHIGDITFRVRESGASEWVSGDSAASRAPVSPLPVSGNTLAAANLSPTLPSGSLLNITRRWELSDDGDLQLLFDVENAHSSTVEIGSLGAPLEFDNIFTDRTATDTNNLCSVFDPYIGQDAGFVQVTPLLGTLSALVVVPLGASPLEAWRFLPEPTSTFPFYQSQTFEGLYEWQFHSVAYAENEWSGVEPWNSPTSTTLEPGESRIYGLKFLVADHIQSIEDTLIDAGRPVAAGIPGFIVPADQIAKLFLNYDSAVSNISVSPSGALSWEQNSDAVSSEWVGYDITPAGWGRVRLSISYEDGTIQTVHYHLTHGATQTIADLGSFLTNEQWFDDPSDPFARSPSVITYDREVNAVVKDDPRVWIAGLSDEGGAGSFLSAFMKQYLQPNADEVAKLEIFANSIITGSLQNNDDSVKKSLYYYEPSLQPDYDYPSSINWGNWWSWNQDAAFLTDRAYDYVHVATAWWALYRVARNYPRVATAQTWEYYLDKAMSTVLRLNPRNVGYVNVGLMGETVFQILLDDLRREGLDSQASDMEDLMRSRWQVWQGEDFPFGSEMAWDSTGQEGVYAWSKYFGDSDTATKTINSIIAFQPLIAHWGYNGNARRYWDNIYGGKLMRIERQIHHYGSGLNALPLLTEFQANPTDFHLLRVGYAGISGALSNIDEDGFASASFHSFADTLHWDAYSGDYGPNFSGHAMGTGTYIVNHPDFGWQAFGGNVVSANNENVTVEVRDDGRRKVFVAPIAALLVLDAGSFDSVTFDPLSGAVEVSILDAPAGVSGAFAAPSGRLVVSQTADADVGVLSPTDPLHVDAGAYVVPFTDGSATVALTP